MSVLAEICAKRRDDCVKLFAGQTLGSLEQQASMASPPRGFKAAIARQSHSSVAFITEIKRASPSQGVIRTGDFNPAVLARDYAAAGATCLSVLTEPHWFMGADDYLVAARAACDLPVLRKDFVVDLSQIPESRALGADCVLLIVAALEDGFLHEATACALATGLDVLVETHDATELERALRLDDRVMIGVNNRNLKNLSVSLESFIAISANIPKDRILVAESGYRSAAEIQTARRYGADAILIGESLMRQDDIGAALRGLKV